MGCGSQDSTQENTSTSSESASPSVASSPNSTASPSSAAATATATKIDATLKEMAIELSSNTVPAGPVEFVIKNNGKEPHEFVVLKNDLKGEKLPLKGDKLDEDAKGLKNIGEVEEDKLKSGATQSLKVDLTPGRYLIVCNIEDHFKKGMKIELTVK